MPFTLAHPAIVLPLKYLPKKWISMTAVIVGSVMPDSESFIRMYGEKGVTHSWPGFFYFGLPMGILVTFIFHSIVRDPLITNLPSFLRQRFSGYTNFDWNKRFLNNWFIVIISMIIGGASHFFWDSFSHFDGWFINMFPALRGNTDVFNSSLEIPYLIQYINTVIGILIILLFIAKLPRIKNDKTQGSSLGFRISFLLLTVAIFIVRIGYMRVNTPDDFIIAFVSASLLALAIIAYVFNKKSWKGFLSFLPVLL